MENPSPLVRIAYANYCASLHVTRYQPLRAESATNLKRPLNKQPAPIAPDKIRSATRAQPTRACCVFVHRGRDRAPRSSLATSSAYQAR